MIHEKRANENWISKGFYVGIIALIAFGSAIGLADVFPQILQVSTPFIIGIALAALSEPIVRWFIKMGIRRRLAVVFLHLVGGSIIYAIASSAIPIIIDQANTFTQNGPTHIAEMSREIDTYLHNHPKIGPLHLPKNTDALVQQVADYASHFVMNSTERLVDFLIGSVTLILQTIIALIVSFYILIDIERIRSRLTFLIPRRHRQHIRKLVNDVIGVFSNYLRCLVVACTLYGLTYVLVTFGMATIHENLGQFALLLGLLAGICYAIPYIGPLTLSTAIFFAGLISGGLGFAIALVVISIILNQVFDDLIWPRIVREGVGLHPVISLIALGIGGEVFQFWGLLLSVPIAACIQLLLIKYYPEKFAVQNV